MSLIFKAKWSNIYYFQFFMKGSDAFVVWFYPGGNKVVCVLISMKMPLWPPGNRHRSSSFIDILFLIVIKKIIVNCSCDIKIFASLASKVIQYKRKWHEVWVLQAVIQTDQNNHCLVNTVDCHLSLLSTPLPSLPDASQTWDVRRPTTAAGFWQRKWLAVYEWMN